MEKSILTVAEFAKEADVSKQLVRHYVRLGTLKTVSVMSERIGLPREQLNPFKSRPHKRVRHKKPYASV